MLFFRSYFFKGSETDLNKLVQKQLALNSTRVTLESSQANVQMSSHYIKNIKQIEVIEFALLSAKKKET